MSTNTPGVTVRENPSGSRAIVGADTSVCAFVDCFLEGPLDTPVPISSLGEFNRVFGGTDPRSEASYAIGQFFLNGGTNAIVSRVARDGDVAAKAFAGKDEGAALEVRAASPGAWGNCLSVAVPADTHPDTFTLTVTRRAAPGSETVVASEVFEGLTPENICDIVGRRSSLIRVPSPPRRRPGPAAATMLTGGADGTVGQGFARRLAGDRAAGTGLFALEKCDGFNLLCVPATMTMIDDDAATVAETAGLYCTERLAFYLMDAPQAAANRDTPQGITAWLAANDGLRSANAALYAPRLRIDDPLDATAQRVVAPSGTMAGIVARTDAQVGVWKAPAGTDAKLDGARSLTYALSDAENETLNALAINALRAMPLYGPICWGARTLVGADNMSEEWQYIPVRRLALYIEQSLRQGLAWVTFEPNAEPTWAAIRQSTDVFLTTLYRRGAFFGSTEKSAFFVQCDATTTTLVDIDAGIVNVVVGFAPVRPAEFVVIELALAAAGGG